MDAFREAGTIFVNVPPETVFNFIGDPGNLPRLLKGNLAEVYDVKPLPTGGYSYRWVYRWAGFPIKASAAMTEFAPHSRIVVESSGGMRTISTWVFEPDGGRTRATFSIEAPDLGILLRRLSGRFIANQLRFAVEVALTNIKHMAEQSERETKASQDRGDLNQPA